MTKVNFSIILDEEDENMAKRNSRKLVLINLRVNLPLERENIFSNS
jgi:hypothetical protein